MTPVGSVQAPGFLVEGHAPRGLVTALGLALLVPLVKCRTRSFYKHTASLRVVQGPSPSSACSRAERTVPSEVVRSLCCFSG